MLWDRAELGSKRGEEGARGVNRRRVKGRVGGEAFKECMGVVRGSEEERNQENSLT